ncbi:MAG: Uma2 family endonuclease, partial [Armatimonadota bacterium]|nr:Uma2 family endonuclease [Armatimonadota bacterium]
GVGLLEAGDRLEQPEFHALYEAMPQGFRAELIGGIVHMPSPVKLPHSRVQTRAILWLDQFEQATPGTECLLTPSVVPGGNSEPEPDAVLRILPSHGGASWDEDNYLTGVPELFVEVSSSTAGFDLGEKRAAYEQAGVPEYLVLLERQRQARWFVLEDGKYIELVMDDAGVMKSRIFPGLWLLPEALFSGDKRRVREVLQAGTSSEKHGEFTTKLAAGRQASSDGEAG